ncbi:MAG: hypothetical protein AAFV53_33540 [Myxococcota bacterium]
MNRVAMNRVAIPLIVAAFVLSGVLVVLYVVQSRAGGLSVDVHLPDSPMSFAVPLSRFRDKAGGWSVVQIRARMPPPEFDVLGEDVLILADRRIIYQQLSQVLHQARARGGQRFFLAVNSADARRDALPEAPPNGQPMLVLRGPGVGAQLVAFDLIRSRSLAQLRENPSSMARFLGERPAGQALLVAPNAMPLGILTRITGQLYGLGATRLALPAARNERTRGLLDALLREAPAAPLDTGAPPTAPEADAATALPTDGDVSVLPLGLASDEETEAVFSQGYSQKALWYLQYDVVDKARWATVWACHGEFVTGPMSVRFQVNDEGYAYAVRVNGDEKLEACVLGAFNDLTFPEHWSPEGLEVQVPLRF